MACAGREQNEDDVRQRGGLRRGARGAGQARNVQPQASTDPDNEEMQQSETRSRQGEQAREDAAKKE